MLAGQRPQMPQGGSENKPTSEGQTPGWGQGTCGRVPDVCPAFAHWGRLGSLAVSITRVSLVREPRTWGCRAWAPAWPWLVPTAAPGVVPG